MRFSLPLTVLGLLVLVLAGLALRLGRPAAAQAPVDGQAVYQERCAFCHGEDGDGNGPVAKYLNPRPRDFTSGLFKFRTTASGELPLREDVINIVKRGVQGTAMPRWEEALGEVEIEAVVDYVMQSFVPDWGTYDPPVIPIPNPPRSTNAMVEQGQQLYQELQCWKCHGDDGRADGPSAPTLTDDFGFPIRAADLTKAWRYKGGSELVDIYTRFSTGLNGSPMPSFYEVPVGDHQITEEKLWAISAYVQSLQANQPTEETVITAKRIEGGVPSWDDPAWESARPVSVYLTGQVIAGPRWQTPGVDAVTVRALHNDDALALLIEWNDPFQDTQSGGSDTGLGTDTYVDLEQFLAAAGPFPDAFAVQFPQKLSEGPQKPYFFWGQPGKPVIVWKWQADERMTFGSLGEYTASGFKDGLKPQTEASVGAGATWANGRYRLLITHPLVTPDANDLQMVPGEFIPIAFQAWEGSNGESGARMALSSWYSLVLEKPTPANVYVYTGLAVALAAAAEWSLVRRARRRPSAGSRPA